MIPLNQISIGDWYRYRYTTCDTHREIVRTFRVTAIERMTGDYYVWGVDQNGKSLGRICYPEQLEGIEITKEILEKNGFKRFDAGFFLDDDYFDITICEWSDSIWVYRYEGTAFEQVTIGYVHELQHALNACAVELKIEL